MGNALRAGQLDTERSHSGRRLLKPRSRGQWGKGPSHTYHCACVRAVGPGRSPVHAALRLRAPASLLLAAAGRFAIAPLYVRRPLRMCACRMHVCWQQQGCRPPLGAHYCSQQGCRPPLGAHYSSQLQRRPAITCFWRAATKRAASASARLALRLLLAVAASTSRAVACARSSCRAVLGCRAGGRDRARLLVKTHECGHGCVGNTLARPSWVWRAW
jgi:hypothetical protein